MATDVYKSQFRSKHCSAMYIMEQEKVGDTRHMSSSTIDPLENELVDE